MPRTSRTSCAPRRRTIPHIAPRSVGRRPSASAPRRRRRSTGQCQARTSPIKVLPPLASRAEPPATACARRRLPPWPPPPSRVPTSSRGRATVPGPPLASAGTDRAVSSRAPAESSPEPGIPWLAAAAAAARLCQGHHCPELRSNSVPSNPSTTPRPSPAGPATGPRRIFPHLAVRHPGGPNCGLSVIYEGQSAK
jgi:hypothetical protein